MAALAPGMGSTRMPAACAAATRCAPGIRHHRRAGVRNERNRFPGLQPGDERRGFRPFVVLVQARRARRDGVVLKEARRPAGVLGRYQGHFTQGAKGPQA